MFTKEQEDRLLAVVPDEVWEDVMRARVPSAGARVPVRSPLGRAKAVTPATPKRAIFSHPFGRWMWCAFQVPPSRTGTGPLGRISVGVVLALLGVWAFA